MSKHALLFFAPPHLFTQETAATLSPRSAIGSPTDSGLSPTSSSITQAVTTIPSNSSKLIVTVQVSRCSAFYFNSVVSAGGRSYLQKNLLSTQCTPTASKLASDRQFF